jgi:hypothetical protein
VKETPFVYRPLDLRCPHDDCQAPPGSPCIWRRANGKPTFRRAHAERVTAARAATTKARNRALRRPRVSSSRSPWAR